MKKITIIIAITCILTGYNRAGAQFVEDALRYSSSDYFYTPRASALNIAYQGVLDDYSALFLNPAGLVNIQKREFSVGVGFDLNSVATSYLGNNQNFNSNTANITHLGMVFPIEFMDKTAAFGIGYARENSFNRSMDYEGYNTSSSMIDYYTHQTYSNVNDNPAYWLWLADTVGGNGLHTPLTKNLYQKAYVQESGGLHDFSAGIAVDFTDNFSVGFTLTGKWGSYRFYREYSETDINNIYNVDMKDYSNLAFNKMNVQEELNQDVSGLGGILGFMYHYKDLFKFGASITFPTVYNISENYSLNAQSQFDDDSLYNYTSNGRQDYTITTPFIFSGGLSVHYFNFTLSFGAEYNDVSQLSFSNLPYNNQDLNTSLNSQIAQNLTGQFTYGFGLEYEFPNLPIDLRCSFASTNSPYKDGSGLDVTMVSGGVGLYLASNVRLDFLGRYSKTSDIGSVYGSYNPLYPSIYSTYSYTNKLTNLGLQLTYRF